MPDLAVKNLTVRYRSKQNRKDFVIAIDDLTATFKANTFNVILGPSGCGKTTLLRSIIGSLEVDGNIMFGDKNFCYLAIQDRNISYVGQNYILYPRMTIFDNIAFPLKNRRENREEIIKKVTDIATDFDLEYCLTRKPKHLSGGQQQRVALARAMIKKSDVYLFDEPFSNADAPERTRMRSIIKDTITKNNAIAIYVTHDFNEALTLADRIFVMENGRITLEGTPTEIYDSNDELIVAYKNEMRGKK